MLSRKLLLLPQTQCQYGNQRTSPAKGRLPPLSIYSDRTDKGENFKSIARGLRTFRTLYSPSLVQCRVGGRRSPEGFFRSEDDQGDARETTSYD